MCCEEVEIVFCFLMLAKPASNFFKSSSKSNIFIFIHEVSARNNKLKSHQHELFTTVLSEPEI